MRAGLGDGWDCVLANDISPLKCDVYAKNWGADNLIKGDIAQLDQQHLHHDIDLYWASSPCQDFSLAGKGLGLTGKRSGVFWDWASLITGAVKAGFGPRIIAFENVLGLITRNGGQDFAQVLKTFRKLGYRVGALEIDATHFLPQSRPRLFVIAVKDGTDISGLASKKPDGPFHTDKINRFVNGLNGAQRRDWIYWKHSAPNDLRPALASIVDERPDTKWLTKPELKNLLGMMSKPNADRVALAKKSGSVEIGMLYKRGRPDETGQVRQRAEVRFDGTAGCLRTPAGGSSRQTIMLVEGNKIKARLISSLEMTRLMGLSDSYAMPERYNSAYQVAGDGVAVPIVRYLDQTLFRPILALQKEQAAA